MIDDIARVMRLDRSVYGEIARDGTRAGMLSAASVVALVAVVTTLGAAVQIATGDAPRSTRLLGAIAGSLLDPFIHWVIWSALLVAVGSLLFRADVAFPTVLRELGYAQAPLILTALAFLPLVGPAIVLLGQLFSLRAGSLATQHAFAFDTRRTIATIGVTFAAAFVISSAVRAFLANIGLWDAFIAP
jgi:hypothetical protein